MSVKERVAIPNTTSFKWRKELLKASHLPSCSHRGKIVYELGYNEALETLLARDITKKFDLSKKEWQAVFAACNGNSMFWPQTVEGFFMQGSDLVNTHVPPRPLSWQFREWCRYSYEEATQFGDPNVLYRETGEKIDLLSDAEQFFVMRLMADLWEGYGGYDVGRIMEYLAERAGVATKKNEEKGGGR